MILVWDTSSLSLSVGLFSDSVCQFYRDEFRETHQQSRLLFSTLKEVLSESGLSPKEVQALAAGVGPGSYTGLRVGLTVLKLWSFARKIPAYTFRSDLCLERTQAAESGAIYPQVRYLHWPDDFTKVEDLNVLEPIYHNDHFS